LQNALSAAGVSGKWEDLQSRLSGKKIKLVLVAGPEDQSVYPDIEEKVRLMGGAEALIWLTAGLSAVLDQSGTETWQIPLKTHLEKAGSFTNHSGKTQSFKAGTTIVPQALTLTEAVELMAGRDLDWNMRPRPLGGPKTNYAVAHRGAL
jgi:NADH-quinone oxidoreductase subunit G